MTTLQKKAAKKFCDGILELPAGGVGAAAAAGACCLYDMDGKAVFRGKARKYVPPPAPGAGGFGGKRCKAASKEDEGDGEEEEDEEGGSSGRRYELGSWVAEVDRDVAPQDFRSGACFLKKGGRGGAADVLAAAAMRGGAAAVGMKLGATGGGRLAPPARPGLASTGAAATGAAAGGPKPAGRPLHDPSAAGAAVLNDCQWKGGAGMLAGGPRGGCGRPVVPVVLDPFLGRHMRPHQVEGIRFMYECVAGLREPGRFGCILADEMGLGKTAQTLSLIWTLLRQGPEGRPLVGKAIVACPATLVRNWGAEVRKWLGSERLQAVVLTQGPDAQQKIVDFKLGTVWRLLIGSYEALRKHASDLSGAADLLVCDEGHRLKAGQGNKTVDALMQLGCSRRVLLTGTPVQNNLSEFYALLSFVAPDLLGSPAVFKRLYGDPITASRDRAATAAQRELGASRAAELHAAVGRFVLRRTQALLTRHLPPLAVYVVFCRPSPLQVSLYRHVIASKAVTCLMYGGGEATEVAAATLSAITALRKLCNHPDLLLQGPNAGQDASASAGSAAAGGGSGGWLQGCPPFETGVVAHSGKLAALDALLASVITSSGTYQLASGHLSTVRYGNTRHACAAPDAGSLCLSHNNLPLLPPPLTPFPSPRACCVRDPATGVQASAQWWCRPARPPSTSSPRCSAARAATAWRASTATPQWRSGRL